MSQYKEAEIGEIVYFWFAANTAAGAAGDGTAPLYDLRLAGAAAGVAPIASGTPALLTDTGYADGLHEIAIDTTGYAAGEYALFSTLTISSVNPSGFCGSMRLKAPGTSTHSASSRVMTALPNVPAGTTGGLVLVGQPTAVVPGEGWSDSDLAALDAAIKTGVREVQYRDRRVMYHSLDEMLKLRQLMREEVAGGTVLGNVRTTLASFTKG